MATITTADGQVIDLDTGSVVGQTEAPVPVSQQEIPTTAMDIARQGSYAFNAALFALPDAGVKAIGKALGLPDDEVVTLTKIFNKGDRAAKNSAERYARAIGDAVGANVPLTGVLSYMAKTKALAAPLMSDAGVMKRVAKETLDFIRANPRAAFLADIGSGVAFGATRQAVEENMEPGVAKDITREVLPLAASVVAPTVGIATGAAYSKVAPSALAARYGKQLIAPSDQHLTQVGREIAGEYPFLLRPLVRGMVSRAERKAGQAIGHEGVQLGIKETDQLIADLGAQGLKLNTAEQTMMPYFIKEQGNAIKSMSPEQIKAELARRAENMNQFDLILERLAPKSNLTAEDALNTIRADAETVQNNILQKIADEKGIEAARLADRYTPANRDVLGQDIREAILGGGESAFWNLRNVESRMGLRNRFTKDGVPLPTRDSQGVSQFPSTDINKPVSAILEKYFPKMGPIKERSPYLAAVLGRFKRGQEGKGASAYQDALTKELTDIFAARNRPGAGGKTPDFLAPDEAAMSTAQADRAFLQQQEFNARSLVDALLTPSTGTGKRAGLADLNLPAGKQQELLAKSFGLEPEQLNAAITRAKESASKVGQVDINFPEAVELLQATTDYRNNAIRRFNEAQLSGKNRLAAQKELDKANAFHKDVSDMLFQAVPKLGKEYSTFKQAYNDIYGGAYERYVPLLVGAKRPTGEFLTANEAVVAQAFKSAENMRDVKTLLSGTAQGDELLTRATMDWLRGKNVLDADGILDARKLEAVLKQNKNIVDALPGPLQSALQDELATGKAFASRMAQLEARKESAIDAELNRLLKQISREGAEPGPIIDRALSNPADMKSLVNAVQGKPELLEALRREVYDRASQSFGDKSIDSFLANTNQKSLSFLFTPEQFTNLRKLGDLEKRIRVSEGIVDTPKPFETTDEALQRIAGVSIRNLTTMYRGMTGVGGVKPSPMDAGVYLLMRLAGRQEYGVMDRVMQKAITDPAFAKALVDNAEQTTLAKQMAKLNKQAMIKGVYIPEVVFKAPLRATMTDIATSLQEEPAPETPQAPVTPPAPAAAPAPTAKDMMSLFKKQQPAAPQTRGTPQQQAPQQLKPAFPTQAPKSGGNAAQMYQSLFPNDTIGNLIQQKKQMMGQ